MKLRWLLVSALLTFGGCSQPSKPTALGQNGPSSGNPVRSGDLIRFEPNSPQLTRIKVAPVEMAEVPMDELVAPGKVELNPSRMSRIVLPFAGRIRSVRVGLGDTVQQGQELLTLESPELSTIQSTLRQADANVSQAEATLAKAEADLARARDLLENRAIAQKEVLAAETTVTQAKAALEQATATREDVLRRLRLLGLEPGDRDQVVTIRAPLAGKVVELAVAPGEYRNDTAQPVLTVADLSTVWVAADVPENAIRLIRIGEPVEVTLPAFPDRKFGGRVKRIGDLVDPQTRTIKVRAELNNPHGDFRPEMFATIRHSQGQRPAIIVPKAALLQEEGGNVVYVERSPGQFQKMPVEIMWQGANQIAIGSGISSGARVVVDGAMLLKGAAR